MSDDDLDQTDAGTMSVTADAVSDPSSDPALDDPVTEPGWFRAHRLRWTLLFGFGALLLAGLAVSLTVHTNYVAYAPGSATSTAGLIEVDGEPVVEGSGEIDYLTIRIKRLTLLEQAISWIDDDQDIFHRDEVFGKQSRAEVRQCNLQMMRTSKSTAELVALSALGYDVLDPAGVVIEFVLSGFPADGVVTCGDEVLSVDGVDIESAVDLREQLVGHGAGDAVTLVLKRTDTGEEREVTVELAPDPSGGGGGFLGVQPQTLFSDADLPIDVDIPTGNVGGPSAGLAFTLSILDALTEGSLTGGQHVAVTGTIALDGTVGPIGGVRQKAIVARSSGAQVFIVPASLVDEARTKAGDMPVVGVETLDEALAALAELGGSGIDNLSGTLAAPAPITDGGS